MNNIHSSDEVEEGDGETVEGGDAVVESAPEGGMGPEIADESYGIDPIAGGGFGPEQQTTNLSVNEGDSIPLVGGGAIGSLNHVWSSSDDTTATVTGDWNKATVAGIKPGKVTITHTYDVNDYTTGFVGKRTETFTVTVERVTGSVRVYLYVELKSDNAAVLERFKKDYNDHGYVTYGYIDIPRSAVKGLSETPSGDAGYITDTYGVGDYINSHKEEIQFKDNTIWKLPGFNRNDIVWTNGKLAHSAGADDYLPSTQSCYHYDGTYTIKSESTVTVHYVDEDGQPIKEPYDESGTSIKNPYEEEVAYGESYDVSAQIPQTITDEDGRIYKRYEVTGEATSGNIAGADVEIIAHYREKTYNVRYEWSGLPEEQPGGKSEPLPTAPVDNKEYKLGASYTVSETPAKDTVYQVLDDYGNLLKEYKFSGWDNNGGTIDNEDVVVTGTWELTESHAESEYQHTVSYVLNSEAKPEGWNVPETETYAEKQHYNVEPAPGPINTEDDYHNVTGTWTFDGWKDAEGNTVSGDQVMGMEDVTYTGSWTYEAKELDKYHVTYEYTGLPEGEGVPAAPVDDTEYVNHQPYTVKTPDVAVYYEKDENGDTVAVYNFEGWDAKSGEIDGADVTITGSWKKTEVGEGEGVLTVKYVNESNEPIKESYVQVFAEGESYNVNNKTIIPDAIKNDSDNYIYVSTEGTTEGTMTKDGVEITVVYTLDNIGGGEDGKQPDGTPDKDEAVIYYVAEENGTVDPSFEKFTFEGEETTKEVTAESTASAKDGYHFDSWTYEGEAVEGAEAALGQSITVGAGKTYTFTASFAVNTSTAPTEPTDPGTDPTDPGTDPTDPGTDPTDPGTDPTDPGTDPTDPGTDPTDPGTDPTDPGTDPTDPGTDPTDPDDPDDPDDPPTPPAPVNPDNPGGPDDPAGPADPAGPNDPAGPGGPDAPEGPQDEVNIDDEGVPLASLPSQAAAAQQDYVVNEEAEIADNDTPLAGMTEVRCCILHFLIMMCALAVTVYYTHDRKRRQEQEFEVRSELAH